MTGRKIEAFFRRIDHRPGGELLAVESLTAGSMVRDVSLAVCAGEIVGLAGLIGSGKSEIGRACFGLEPITGGTLRFLGRRVTRPTPRAMLDAGPVLFPPRPPRGGARVGGRVPRDHRPPLPPLAV